MLFYSYILCVDCRSHFTYSCMVGAPITGVLLHAVYLVCQYLPSVSKMHGNRTLSFFIEMGK